jgi:5-methylcytosine-specific restriction endonuclease McrA
LTEFAQYSAGPKRGYRWSCKRCVGEAVTRRKQKLKRILVEEAGGRCTVCGYDRCIVNLGFHHIHPSQKSFAMSMGVGRSIAAFREEAKKCVLVCANCHGEIEAGVVASPPPGARYPSKSRRAGRLESTA